MRPILPLLTSCARPSNDGRIEIKDAPGARLADRRSVMDLIRIDGDEVAGLRLDYATPAQRPLSTGER